MTRKLSNDYSAELVKAVHHGQHENYYFQQNLFRPDDYILASYPRSGSHFVRFIILSARHYRNHGRFPADLSEMTSIPDVHGGDVHLASGSPRIIKSHFPYDPRYRNVIHLVRDPRDVIVSYYHYTKNLPHLFFTEIPNKLKLPRFVDLFIDGKIWPCEYGFHSRSFQDQAASINYLRIHYEDLVNNPLGEYARLFGHIGLQFNETEIEKLARHTSFINMSKLHNPATALQGRVNPQRKHVLRKGVTGGYKNILKKADLDRIESVYSEFISSL